MTTELDTFETRLLAQLRREVATVDAPAAAGRRVHRSLAVAAAVAATAVAGVLLVPSIGTTPAYSVQEGNSGEIIVEVNRPEDAPGLEGLLADHGVTAEVTYLEWPLQCAPDRYADAPSDQTTGVQLSIGSDTLRVTLPPGAVRDGDTFVMSVAYRAIENGGTSVVDLGVTPGPVGACDPR